MIARLRRRMTVLVAVVLLLVTSGIIFSINYINWRNIVAQAEDALETLAQNSGARPEIKRQGMQRPPEGVDKEPPGEEDREPPDGEGEEFAEGEDKASPGGGGENPPQEREASGTGRGRRSLGQPVETDDALASLSNYYVVTLSSDDSVKSWTSDRADLYTDEQVADITEIILSEGKESGRIGTQFYRLTSQNGKKLLIILDERLDMMSAGRVLRMTTLTASIACLLLCIAAYILIRFMVKPVQEAFDRQRQFVWDASHELKTPLAVIGANADVLRGEIGENEHLGYIHSEVYRTNKLIQNLLTLARLDRGKANISLQEMDLSKAVLSVALPFESTAFEEGKQFELNVPEGIFCTGDPSMLQQLTVILLSNALKYADDGGRIVLQVSAKGKSREIRVSNTGEGIPPEDQSRIFDRFYRADSSHNREVEGYGLGLSIAKNIVDAHKGKIRVASEPFGETVFAVHLPG